jgi:heme/copper-type cytochrome/quinol oxidase subunit 1
MVFLPDPVDSGSPGNFSSPRSAPDLAFPRINLLSWYVYIIGGVFMFAAVVAGGVDTGWTFYANSSTCASNTSLRQGSVCSSRILRS